MRRTNIYNGRKYIHRLQPKDEAEYAEYINIYCNLCQEEICNLKIWQQKTYRLLPKKVFRIFPEQVHTYTCFYKKQPEI